MALLLFLVLCSWVSTPVTITQREIHDVEPKVQGDYGWWEFPANAVFTHQDGTRITLDAFYNGDRRWMVRFAPPSPGKWEYRVYSSDRGLDGVSGEIYALSPDPGEIHRNPNYRGHVRISGNGRYFTCHDSTPVLLLGDTNWALNTARCGLGKNQKGPFYQYLEDRRLKGFNAIRENGFVVAAHPTWFAKTRYCFFDNV